MGWGDVASGKAGSAAAPSRKGGWGSVANAGVAPEHQQQPHHGGGGIGGFFHAVGSKVGLAAHDIKQIPGGLYTAGLAVAHDTLKAETKLPFIGHGLESPSERRFAKGPYETPGLARATVHSAVESLRHPLRDPFQTGLTLAPLIGTAGRIGEGGIAAADASRAGEGGLAAARAAGRKLVEHGGQPTRTLHVGEDRTPVAMIGSRNAGVRLMQRGYDRMVQGALDREARGEVSGRVVGRVAKHGMKRAAGALNEQERIAQRIRGVPANLLDRSAVKLSKTPGKAGSRVHQAALELTSTQTPAHEAAAYHYAQAVKGINPAQNARVAKLYEKVAQHDLVHVDESRPAGQKVYINQAEKKLAEADAKLAKVQERGDTTLAEHGVMSPGELEQRRNAPARIRAGATYEKPTPGKLGIESPTLKAARAKVARLEKTHASATEKALKNPRSAGHPTGENSPTVARLSSALSVAKDDLQRLEQQAGKRVKPTGIVGGEEARPGRGFVSERISQKKLARSQAAASRSQVVGEPRSPIDTKTYTGRALEHGLRPKDVTGAASHHLRQVQRFENTAAIRARAVEAGSDVRRSTRDILVRKAGESPEEISAHIRQVLGQERSAVDTPEELRRATDEPAVQAGLAAAHRMVVQRWLDRADESKAAGIGESAPKGYRWVDENLLKGLEEPSRAKGGAGAGIGRAVDSANSAVTAMTVYFKIGHIGTRVLTNAATNLMQGSLKPLDVARSFKLWNALSEEERARFLAASGQHGFAALPHDEGLGNIIARGISSGASKGAQFWARHADAPFRFNSLAYEFRRAGYRTPEQIGTALHALEHHGDGVPAHEWSKISTAARRADREAISYDRLNDFERRFLTRAVWFYPWVKGSTLFTVRSILEHPYKMGALGNLGAVGRERQQRLLGDVPSYEEGLIPLTGGDHPRTTDLSTFSPFATAGDVLDIPRIPGSIAEQFNPAVGAGGELAYGLNQYGAPAQDPYKAALEALIAPTPESQIAQAFQARHEDQSGRMFEKTPGSTLLRFLVGPAMPRRVNRSALAKAAARERSGQR